MSGFAKKIVGDSLAHCFDILVAIWKKLTLDIFLPPNFQPIFFLQSYHCYLDAPKENSTVFSDVFCYHIINTEIADQTYPLCMSCLLLLARKLAGLLRESCQKFPKKDVNTGHVPYYRNNSSFFFLPLSQKKLFFFQRTQKQEWMIHQSKPANKIFLLE